MDQVVGIQPKFLPVRDSHGARTYVNTNCISEIRPDDRYDSGNYTIYYKTCNDSGAPRYCQATAKGSFIDTLI